MTPTTYALIHSVSAILCTLVLVAGFIVWDARKSRRADSQESTVLDPDLDAEFVDSLDQPGSLPFPGETPLELAIREGRTVKELVEDGWNIRLEPETEALTPHEQTELDALLSDARSEKARRQVSKVLLAADEPLSVDAIHSQTLRLQPISVGRVLWRMRDAGLVEVTGRTKEEYRFAARESRRFFLEGLVSIDNLIDAGDGSTAVTA